MRGIVALAAALALAALPAAAAPRLQASPVFAPLRASDPACAIVTIENDGEARRVVLHGRRSSSTGTAAASETMRRMRTEVALELPPGARKRLVLPMPADADPNGVVWLEQDGVAIAMTSVDFSWCRNDRVPVAALGMLPPALVGRSRKDLLAEVMEVAPSDLPSRAETWPDLHALAWDEPRSTELAPSQVRALREYVQSGGRLVAGMTSEEPAALLKLGLGDMLPARPATQDGDAPQWEALASARRMPAGDAFEGAYGRGSVVLVTHPLSAAAASDWDALLAMPPAPDAAADPRQTARRRYAAWTAHAPVLARQTLERLAPEPPLKPAAALMVAFLLAAVPVDAWLTRRSLRRGHRSRYGALRYPAIVVAATAAAFVLAGRASGGDMRLSRIDVARLGADGRGIGRSFLFVGRGRTGDLELDAPGASVAGAGSASPWDYDTTGVSSVLHATADPVAPASSVTVDAGPWQPILMQLRWIPQGLPPVAPPGPGADAFVIPACDGALIGLPQGDRMTFRQLGPRAAGPLTWDAPARPQNDEDLRDGLVQVAEREPPGEPLLVLAWRRRLGPEAAVDGEPSDRDRVLSFVTLRLPGAAVPQEAP